MHSHPQHATSFGAIFAAGIILNLLYVMVEFGVGSHIGSLGLIADAGHNFSDVLALVIAWAGQALSLASPTKRKTYGLKRASILASLSNALLLLAATAWIAWQSLSRLQAPAFVPPMPIVWVSLVGLLINFGTAALLASKRDDVNVQGAYLHMLADGAVTAGVLFSGLLIAATEQPWIDPAVSLAVAAVIAWQAWKLLAKATNLALDGVPDDIDVHALSKFLLGLDGVSALHDLHVWAMGSEETAMTVHLVIDETRTNAASTVEQASLGARKRFPIVHTTIQVETLGEPFACSSCRGQQGQNYPIF